MSCEEHDRHTHSLASRMGLLLTGLMGAGFAPAAAFTTAIAQPEAGSATAPAGDAQACELGTVFEAPAAADPTTQALCSVALGVAERIPVGTILVPFGTRDGHIVTAGEVVARHGRCGPNGLSLLMVIKPTGKRRSLPSLSAYTFMDVWIEGVAAWGTDRLGAHGIDELRVAWVEGKDPGGQQTVRLAGHWQYFPTDGVRGDVVYDGATVPLEQVYTAPTHRFARQRPRRMPSPPTTFSDRPTY